MASLTAHQVAAWLRAHTPVQEMHINALLQQEADGDVLDLLNKADLQSMTGRVRPRAFIASAWTKQRSAGTGIMRTTVHDEAAQLQPGTRVTVISVTRGWAHVQLAGNRGWVAETDVLLDAQAPVEARAEASVNASAEQLFDATAPPVHCKHGSSQHGEKHLLSNLASTPFIDGCGNEHDTLEAWFQSRKTNAGHERTNCCRGGCCSLGHATCRCTNEIG